MEGGGEGDGGWMSQDIAEHVRLMHEITWGPLVSVFSEVGGGGAAARVFAHGRVTTLTNKG